MANILLEGNLASISFPNLVQLLRLEQKDCKLELSRVAVSQSAEMYFSKGQLKYAAVNTLTGEDAMLRIICWWNCGEFKVLAVDQAEMPSPNITKQIDWILLEGMRRMDECHQFKALLPDLASAVSFTQEALDAFKWDRSDPPEWIPHWMRRLPRSFSIAQLFDISTLGAEESCAALKSLLYTNATVAHTVDGDVDPAHAPIQRTRFDSFSLIVMEYVGYDVARSLVESAVQEIGAEAMESLTFGQMVDLSDRLGLAISRMVGFDEGQDAMRKLRARITSLL
ncbi:MAG: DUF4388 domain-containing protein [Cyanobacteria bacterium NC_groundwater_1444_Ag_S-0.65um_54_12]|nr:DUF4388 domain-containing protein [Cyanobacteria bacterium NC_groundwater_1444_Ag_S-0.65um_54_12]